MAEIVAPPSGIEGQRVSGQSRKPLAAAAPPQVRDGRLVFAFRARFDVFAKIDECLASDAFRLGEGASTVMGDVVNCEQALIRTLDRKPARSVGPGSHTHNTNHWRMTKQTCVTVVRGHSEIMNALAKRSAPRPH